MNFRQRDTKDWYLGKDPLIFVSEDIFDFIKKRTGKKILDFGSGLGGYSARLTQLGFECTALDSNDKYVQIARNMGVNAHLQKGNKIEFPDGSFDTVIMVEVLEHLDDPGPTLEEIKRVAKNNVLITCPNCTEDHLLQKTGLTFEHLLETDHKQFFTFSSLKEILQKHFAQVAVLEKEPVEKKLIDALLPGHFFKALLLTLYNFNLFRPRVFFRLYAEAKK